MAGPIEIDVWQGDIAELEVDALVVSANESLFMTAGAAASVKRHGGEEIERDAIDQGPAEAGTAIVTRGGSLAATYVIHAVGVGHDRRPDREQLAASILTALGFAEPLQLRRIAFSLIGVEHGAFSAADAASVLVDSLVATADGRELPIGITIATANDAQTRAAVTALATRRSPVS
ncbi:MAG: macro domain-containing protein [Chloroflexota bacterium]|nr:macro domain-containing protein [Chloroflexota bacterium]